MARAGFREMPLVRSGQRQGHLEAKVTLFANPGVVGLLDKSTQHRDHLLKEYFQLYKITKFNEFQ